jgi:hypothetical protein
MSTKNLVEKIFTLESDIARLKAERIEQDKWWNQEMKDVNADRDRWREMAGKLAKEVERLLRASCAVASPLRKARPMAR